MPPLEFVREGLRPGGGEDHAAFADFEDRIINFGTDREGEVIRMTLIPMAYYVVQAGLIGMGLIYGGIWLILAVVWLAIVLTAMAFNRSRRPVAAQEPAPAR